MYQKISRTNHCEKSGAHVKKSVPKSVSIRSCDGHLDTESILSYLYAWLWRRECEKGIVQCFGENVLQNAR